MGGTALEGEGEGREGGENGVGGNGGAAHEIPVTRKQEMSQWESGIFIC